MVVGAIKGRRGLHNPELEFDGSKELLDGLYRVVKLSCKFFLFWVLLLRKTLFFRSHTLEIIVALWKAS